jgi:hypothetical protein
MNHLKHVVAAFGVVAASVAVSAGPATAAAPANGTNCHGVYLSYLATSGMSPGQLHQDYGASVQDVQDTANVVCQA